MSKTLIIRKKTTNCSRASHHLILEIALIDHDISTLLLQFLGADNTCITPLMTLTLHINSGINLQIVLFLYVCSPSAPFSRLPDTLIRVLHSAHLFFLPSMS